MRLKVKSEDLKVTSADITQKGGDLNFSLNFNSFCEFKKKQKDT